MKKQKIKLLVLTMAFGTSTVFSGCSANERSQIKPNQPTARFMSLEEKKESGGVTFDDGSYSGNAYESEEMLSPKEEEKIEEMRRNEISKQYSIYAPYGMTYDPKQDRFFYHGQIVRYFKDPINLDETNGFFYENGVVDVEPIKDANGTFIGLKQSSEAEFSARTKEQEKRKEELEKNGITVEKGSFELGDPNEYDDSLDAYKEFHISYDKTSKHWLYGETPIYILYDKDHMIFCDAGVSDGICLSVARDKVGNIEQVVSVNEKEVEKFVT